MEGDDANPRTQEEPLAAIQTAVEEAGPGQTVYVHPGEYFEFIEFRTDGDPNAPIIAATTSGGSQPEM